MQLKYRTRLAGLDSASGITTSRTQSKMTNPAFLVEGDLEQKLVQAICPGAPVQKINTNGKSVTIAAIAKRVGTLGRLLHKRSSPIVVVFDREQREETAVEIERALLECLSSEQIQVPVIVGVADRDVENWILADYQTFQQLADIESKGVDVDFEGMKGKSVIKRLLVGRRYVETIDGVKWLRTCRPAMMRAKSPSFARFATALSSLGCWWLDQDHLDIDPASA